MSVSEILQTDCQLDDIAAGRLVASSDELLDLLIRWRKETIRDAEY